MILYKFLGQAKSFLTCSSPLFTKKEVPDTVADGILVWCPLKDARSHARQVTLHASVSLTQLSSFLGDGNIIFSAVVQACIPRTQNLFQE